MPTVVCTTCNRNLDVTGVLESVECECGETISIAESSAPTKPCPTCNASTPIASIVCTECGYNFQTGGTMTTDTADAEDSEGDEWEEDEDEVSFYYRYKPLIHMGIVLVILGLAAIVYMIETGKHFGISDDTPIGTAQEIEEYLQKIGMTKVDDPFNPLIRAGVKGKCITYKDTQLFEQTKGMYDEYVHLILDESGRAAAICGMFISDDMGGPKGGRTHGFLRTFWIDLGGNPEATSMSNDAVHAKWSVYTTTLGLLQFNNEYIGVSLKGSEYEEVVNTFCGGAEEIMIKPVVPGL